MRLGAWDRRIVTNKSFSMKTKGNAVIGRQIIVPDAKPSPSAYWLNLCLLSNHVSDNKSL